MLARACTGGLDLPFWFLVEPVTKVSDLRNGTATTFYLTDMRRK
jgi:hypothetical protein